MKICFYSYTGEVSGAEKILFSVLSGIDPKEHEAIVFAPKSRSFEVFCAEKKLRFHAVTPLTARYTSDPRKLATYFISFTGLIKELRRHLRRERPDLIHANTTRAAIVAALATIGLKVGVFWHIHDMMPRHPLSTLIRLLAVLSGRNRIIAVSRATAKSFIGKLPKWLLVRAPMKVVHNGIDINRFSMGQDGVNAFLTDTGLETSQFLMGIVGQITPRKGHLELIRDLAPLFHTDMPHGRLLVVGTAMFNDDGDYLELLKSETRRLCIDKNVLFLGARDVPTVMKALDVLIHNSSSEPFGLVVAEAMASGTSVIAAAVDGVPEIIDDGVSGLLFNLGDSETLVSHLRALYTKGTLKAGLIREGRARVTALFDEAKMRVGILDLYRSAHPNLVVSSLGRKSHSASSQIQ